MTHPPTVSALFDTMTVMPRHLNSAIGAYFADPLNLDRKQQGSEEGIEQARSS
jgi:hypothetical protein